MLKKRFRWKNEKLEGTLWANSLIEAKAFLQIQNTPYQTIEPAPFFMRSERLSSRQKQRFFHALSLYLEQGLALKTALLLLNESSEHAIQRFTENIISMLTKGITLSIAIKESANNLPDWALQLIHLGEEAGVLNDCIRSIAHYFEKQEKQRRKMISALSYPCFLLLSGIACSIVFIHFSLPSIVDLYNNNQQKLPMLTQSFLSFYRLLSNNAINILISALILMITSTWLYQKKFVFKSICQKIALRINPLYRLIRLSLLLKRCAVFLSSSQNLGMALHHLANDETCIPIKATLTQLIHTLEQGQSLSSGLTEIQHCPKDITLLISLGENAARLPQCIHHLSQLYEEKLEQKLENFTRYIEPIILLILSAITLLVMLAIYLPILDMGRIV